MLDKVNWGALSLPFVLEIQLNQFDLSWPDLTQSDPY